MSVRLGKGCMNFLKPPRTPSIRRTLGCPQVFRVIRRMPSCCHGKAPDDSMMP